VLATGEPAGQKWIRNFQASLGQTVLDLVCEPAFGYLSEQKLRPATTRRRIRTALNKLLTDATSDNCLVWAHNLGIGRNLLLTRELVLACSGRGVSLLAHHHDWWFDNRWLRWSEMRRCGARTLTETAKTIFPAVANLYHLTINRSDARVLQRHFPGRVAWLPNLTERPARTALVRQRGVRAWLQRKLNDGDAPVWILPCRLLRRKNVAEALLLARWLRPEAWLVTTGGVSSADEMSYLNKLSHAAHLHHWRLRLGILQGDETRKPSVPELLAASEAVLLTSIQEGFGLPYLEAAASERPLIARKISNIAPDLEQFGFRFPQYYDELLIEPSLFDWPAESKRQSKLFRTWKSHLPRACQSWTGEPALFTAGGHPAPAPFSRLTLSAQLEVLAQPARHSWKRCAPLNPFLAVWRKRAAEQRLQVTPWPRRAAQWLSGPAYARRFADIIGRPPSGKPTADNGLAAQEQFIREKLDAEHLFPLLWSRES
jgi:hypothetical protein